MNVIFHDSVLMDRLQYSPGNSAEMGGLSGVGEKKLERYADAFLAAIRRHAFLEPAPPMADPSDTALDTIALFRLGLSAEQVAARRNLKSSTIHEHLAQGIVGGQVALDEVVTLTPTQLDELRSVRNALPQPDAPALKPWYDALKGRYSYEILRCVRAEWDRRGM